MHEELSKLDILARNNKQFVSENIEQGNQRKQEVMLEMKSIHSVSGSRASSTSSTTLQAKARAEAAAALKKSERHKRRSVAESQSALDIQREELALAKRKLEEQARLEALRLEDEAAIAVARAEALDEELGFDVGHEQNPIDLPVDNPQTRVQQFIEGQCQQPPTNDPEPTGNPQRTPPFPSPTAKPFVPTNSPAATGSDPNVMKSCLEFMARREVITKKDREVRRPRKLPHLENVLQNHAEGHRYQPSRRALPFDRIYQQRVEEARPEAPQCLYPKPSQRSGGNLEKVRGKIWVRHRANESLSRQDRGFSESRLPGQQKTTGARGPPTQPAVR